MTVENQIPYQGYTANGEQVDFALSFYVENKGNFFVKVNDAVVTVDDYSYNNLTNSIRFHTAPTKDSHIEVERVTSADRSVSYATFNNSFRPEVLNHDIDRIWRKLQELGYADSVLFLRLAKEIADRIAGDKNLQKQIDDLDIQVHKNTADIEDNKNQINELITNLSKEIADRIQADKILKEMFLTIMDEAINEGTVNALAIISVESVDHMLELRVWDGRIVYLKSYYTDLAKGGGIFTYDSSRTAENDQGNVINGWVRDVNSTYLNVHNYGAIGNGLTNEYDHTAFNRVASVIKKSSADVFTIHIPNGTYIVGNQTFAAGIGFNNSDILNVSFSSMTDKQILLKSDGAVLKLKEGMYYGVFDKNTKASFTTTMPFYPSTSSWTQDESKISIAGLGFIINIENIKSLVLTGSLELDGNGSKQNIGGKYGDTGWQIGSYGLRVCNVKQFSVENVHSHDHLLDGMYIAGYNSKTNPDKFEGDWHGSIRNCISTRNGRQACSLCGGQNISFYDCTFTDTATSDMTVRSMPMSGFDIEAEVTPIRNIKIYNTIFSNNGATQMVADSGNTKNVQFFSCRFLNSKTGSACWVRKPQFKFLNCYFNGYIEGQYNTNIEEDRTTYDNCTFTDNPRDNVNVDEGTDYLINAWGANPLFRNCLFDIYTRGWIGDYAYVGTIDPLTLKDCILNFRTIGSVAMGGRYENLIINDLRENPTVAWYPTINGITKNIEVRSPTGISGTALYGNSSLINYSNTVKIRLGSPYLNPDLKTFELKPRANGDATPNITSLVKIQYSDNLASAIYNIDYKLGDTIYCTDPTKKILMWVCSTAGTGIEAKWTEIPMTIKGVSVADTSYTLSSTPTVHELATALSTTVQELRALKNSIKNAGIIASQ